MQERPALAFLHAVRMVVEVPRANLEAGTYSTSAQFQWNHVLIVAWQQVENYF